MCLAVIEKWQIKSSHFTIAFPGTVYGCNRVLPWSATRDTWSNDWKRIKSAGTYGRAGSPVRSLREDCVRAKKVHKLVPKLTLS